MPRPRRKASNIRAGVGGVGGAIRRRSRTKSALVVDNSPLKFVAGERLIPVLNKPTQQHYRHGDYAHVSDLIGKCLRRVGVSEKYNMPIPSEPLWPSTRLTFAQGDAIASVIVEDAVRQVPEQVYAKWSCRCGEEVLLGTHTECFGKSHCDKCDTATTRYNELTFFDDEHMIVGNCDLTLHVGSAFYISEIKSIKGTAFDELSGPKPDHVLQVLFYWWLARRNNIKLYDKVSILYASKDWRFGNPYKEYTLEPSTQLHRLDEYLEDAKALKRFKEEGVLPPRVLCSEISCPKAKKCHVAGPCFDDG